MRKYQDVVAGIFFAHVHSNELRAVPLMPDHYPPMIVSGSIAPCYTTSPFYSYVYYDRGESKFPIDIVTYNLDLDVNTTTANWKRMFQNLTSYLGISALTNREVKRLADQLASNSSLTSASASASVSASASASAVSEEDTNNTAFDHYFQTWYKVSRNI